MLARLHAALTADCTAALTQTPRAQAVHGLGGIGKTQIALEYAYRHAGEYNLVWWIHAEQPATLAEDFVRLATELDLAEKDARDQNVIVAAVHHALLQRQDWLLIFDNVTNPQDLRGFLPQGGHVIITSRHHAWRGAARPLSVETLERNEAIDFLLKRTGQDDRSAADQLADALGDLPLALEQAGAFMDERQMGLADYAGLFSERRQELLQMLKPVDYPEPVATTWNLSFEQVEIESAAASELMNLCAFFAPDDIPLDLLKKSGEYLPAAVAQAAADELQWSNTLAPLLRFSLVAKTDDTISVHRLVQAVVRDRLSEEERKRYAGAAAQIVNDAFPYDSDDVRTWNMCAQLLPHTLAATHYAAAIGAVPEATGRLLNQMGVYLKGRAQFAQAKQIFERAIQIAEATYGPDHPHVAIYVNNLGSVLRALGDSAGAKARYERALKIDEATYGPDHPTVAIRVNNLGLVLQDLGDSAGAKACYERALKIDEATYGPDHPDVAIDGNNLGSVLRALGDSAGAKACLERALKIDEASYGPDHPTVATLVNNLGSVLQDLGDFEGAKACYERALKIDEATYGPDHPTVAIDGNNLGMVLQDLGDFEGAKACYERALHILRKSLGDGHPSTQIVMNNLESLDPELG